MKLLIVRHAAAGSREEFSGTGQSDDERPLTKKGIDDMTDVARGLRRLVDRIDTLATSPLVRARQTADIVAKSFDGSAIQIDALRPETAYAKFEAWARQAKGDVIGAVGHEPHLSGLIAWLIGDGKARIDLKKGGACLLEFDERPRRGAGALKWLLTPDAIARLRR